MTFRKTVLAAAAVAASACAMVAAAPPASAHVVCNAYGDCWSTHQVVRYPRGVHVRVYNDRYADEAYRERQWRRYHRTWRGMDHDHDRGYYRNGVWITF